MWACAIRSDWAVFVLRVPSRACLLRVNLQSVLFASIRRTEECFIVLREESMTDMKDE